MRPPPPLALVQTSVIGRALSARPLLQEAGAGSFAGLHFVLAKRIGPAQADGGLSVIVSWTAPFHHTNALSIFGTQETGKVSWNKVRILDCKAVANRRDVGLT